MLRGFRRPTQCIPEDLGTRFHITEEGAVNMPLGSERRRQRKKRPEEEAEVGFGRRPPRSRVPPAPPSTPPESLRLRLGSASEISDRSGFCDRVSGELRGFGRGGWVPERSRDFSNQWTASSAAPLNPFVAPLRFSTRTVAAWQMTSRVMPSPPHSAGYEGMTRKEALAMNREVVRPSAVRAGSPRPRTPHTPPRCQSPKRAGKASGATRGTQQRQESSLGRLTQVPAPAAPARIATP